MSLGFIRVLVRLKPYVLSFFETLAFPIKKLSRFFIGSIFVPFYHLFYIVRKQIGIAWRPAKNRFMVFVTNRYAVHATVGVIAAVAVFLNLQTTDVRAEAFGEDSLMFAMVTDQDTEIIEESREDASVDIVTVNYREPTALTAYARGVDFIGFGDAPISILGGGALTSP